MTSRLSTCISVQRNNFKISSSVKLKKKKKNMRLVNLFLLFNPRVSTTTVGRELTKDCHEAVKRASIRSDEYNQPSRIFRKSILQI